MQARIIVPMIMAIVAVVMLPTGSIAQHNVNGWYKTEADFTTGLLTGEVSTDPDNRIDVTRGRFRVFRNGTHSPFHVGYVFGYFQNGVKYRRGLTNTLAKQTAFYEVLHEGSLFTYARKTNPHRSNGHTWLYYSVGVSGEIKLLTRKNLNRDFAAHREFLKQALVVFNSSDRPAALAISDLYDTFIGQ